MEGKEVLCLAKGVQTRGNPPPNKLLHIPLFWKDKTKKTVPNPHLLSFH